MAVLAKHGDAAAIMQLAFGNAEGMQGSPPIYLPSASTWT